MNELKPQDVRIGNWVNICHNGRQSGYYSQLDIHDLIAMTDQTTQNVILGHSSIRVQFTFRPIKLTEEILLKAGFVIHKKICGTDGYLKEGWFISDEFKFMVLGSSVILAKLEFTHDLQNIWKELNREELEIKL